MPLQNKMPFDLQMSTQQERVNSRHDTAVKLHANTYYYKVSFFSWIIQCQDVKRIESQDNKSEGY